MSEHIDNETGARKSNGWPSEKVAWYTVAVLLVAYIFSFIDRTILALLVGPLKADLSLTDTEVSLLHGFAFALFYTLMGLPLGRVADARNRRNLIALGVAIWSAMTAVCGLARTFWELFLARVGVGIGEAALSPAAYSMISDNFPPAKRGRALGLYTAGAFVGAGVAFIVGGAVVSLLENAPPLEVGSFGVVKAWQLTFFVVGLPGIVVALLVMTLREPERRGKVEALGTTFGATAKYLWRRKTVFGGHFLGFAMLGLPFNALVAWAPTHYMRNFDLGPGEAGRLVGFTILIFGAAGVVLGGMLADRFASSGKLDGTFRVGIYSAVGCVVFGCVATVLPAFAASAGLLGPLIFFACFGFGAAPAALQIVTPNQMRGQVSAFYLFFLNLISIGAGPTITAGLTDFFFKDEAAVGRSIATTCVVSAFLAVVFLRRAQRPFATLAADPTQPWDGTAQQKTGSR